MQAAGLSPTAGRLPSEIARRLMEKAELRSVRLSETALGALKSFLAIRAPLAEAGERLAAFADETGIFLDDALAGFAARAARIEAFGLPLDGIRYDAGFGRPLDYYTGFIFEIGTDGLSQPLVGGGRYDRLLTLLGAEKPIPGVGFSIWLDRIAALRGETP
jgi:ATP phosphoribosyltransferase regulatory subunit